MKVGDVVKVVDIFGDDSDYKRYKGKVGTIVEIYPSGQYRYRVDIGVKTPKVFMKSELKRLVDFPSKNIYGVIT